MTNIRNLNQVVVMRTMVLAASLLALQSAILGAQGKPAAAPQVDPAAYQALEWRNIGPFRGGRAVAVAGVPQQPHTFYFGATGGGVWKTEDAGVTWANITDGFLKTGSVGAITVAPSDPNVVYVGMGEHPVRGVMTSHGDGVYRSTDAGKTWVNVGLEKTHQISRIRVHPNDPDLVYVAAQGDPYGPNKERGIYRSKDGGKTWALIHFVSESAGASDLAMDPTNPRILYAAYWDHQRMPWQARSGGPGSGLWKSTDGGDTWTKLETGLPKGMGKTGISVSPADPNLVWAIIEADNGGLYRSDDAGKTWTLASGDRLLRARAWYYTEVYADTRDRETVYVLNAPALRSIDGGKSWKSLPIAHGDTHDLWINPQDNRVLALADDGGAAVSINAGKTWSSQNNQPTAQFYRVNTDNRFPYWVYGGQQDNSSVMIRSQVPGGIGITEKDWRDGPGCESAYLAFDRDDPRYVMGTCYQGEVEEMDTETGYGRDIRAYPSNNLAVDPKDQKYRFNWNAPLVGSPHDAKVFYHGGNVLFRTSDRGNTWTPISGDLTRNDKAHQGPGGAPYTNEGAGGEVYGTIFTVAESPKQAGVIWTGSDDGLVHLTRDGGKTWENVTPKDLPESQINAVEASPFDAGTAFIAVTRYKFSDYTPYIFRTRDYGRSWEKIMAGIAPESWARVVREDPSRPGLLYAGTEFGIYVSFNGGDQWQSLQRNLPVVPVTDLQVHGNDLVAATQGRAFWILDGLSALRSLTPTTLAKDVALLEPAPAYRTPGGGFSLPVPNIGRNPAGGVQIFFLLKSAPDSTTPVKLEILDQGGAVIRTIDSVKAKAGLNRVAWNLRHQGPKGLPGVFLMGQVQGRLAVPGDYQVRLSVGGTAQTVPLRVLSDPRHTDPASAYAEQDAVTRVLQTGLADLYAVVRRIRSVRDQVNDLVKRTADRPEGAAVKSAGEVLVKKLTDMEDLLVQPKTTNGQDIINYPPKFDSQLLALMSAIDGKEPPLTAGQKQRFQDVQAEWLKLKGSADALLGADVDGFNALVKDKGVPAVVVPKP